MHSAAPSDALSTESASRSCTWDTNVVKSHPEKRGRIALAALATFGCALGLFHQVAVALIASGIVLASVAEFLLPLRYTLDARGARVTCGPVTWLEMEWSDVRSVYRTPGGVKLSPFRSKTAWLEPLRGILLRCEPHEAPNILSAAETLRAGAQGRP